MELNPNVDNFEVVLPAQLILPEVADDFQKLMEGRNLIHDSILEYFSEALQSISIPDFINEGIKITGHNYQLNKRPSTNDLFRIGDLATTLTFRIMDGMWNYWMARLSYFRYLQNPDGKLNDNVGDLTITFFSNDKSFSYTVTFQKCIFGGIEGQQFTYTSEEIGAGVFFSIGLVYDKMIITMNLPEFEGGETPDGSVTESTQVPNDNTNDGNSDVTVNVSTTDDSDSIPTGGGVSDDDDNIYINGELIT